MNEYGAAALAYWQTDLPTRFSTLPAPEVFFTDLGEQVADQIEATWTEMDRTVPHEVGYLPRVGQLENSKMRAREIVMAEMVYLPSETDVEQIQQEDSPLIDPEGMPVDRSHPLWADLEDDTVSVAEFLRRATAWRAQVRAQTLDPGSR